MFGTFHSENRVVSFQFHENGNLGGYLISKTEPEDIIFIFGIWKNNGLEKYELVFFDNQITKNDQFYTGVAYSAELELKKINTQLTLQWIDLMTGSNGKDIMTSVPRKYSTKSRDSIIWTGFVK